MDDIQEIRRFRMERIAARIAAKTKELLDVTQAYNGLSNAARMDITAAARRIKLIKEIDEE